MITLIYLLCKLKLTKCEWGKFGLEYNNKVG